MCRLKANEEVESYPPSPEFLPSRKLLPDEIGAQKNFIHGGLLPPWHDKKFNINW